MYLIGARILPFTAMKQTTFDFGKKRSLISTESRTPSIRSIMGKKHAGKLKSQSEESPNVPNQDNSELLSLLQYQKLNLSQLKSRLDQTEESLRHANNALLEILRVTKANEREQTRVITELFREGQSLSDAYLGIQKSFSWRITKPLRLILGIFNRFSAAQFAGLEQSIGSQVGPIGRSETDCGPSKRAADPGYSIDHSADSTSDAEKNTEPDPHPLIQAEHAARKFIPVSDSPRSGAEVVRLIAFYLPQFHPIQENDEWWGEGFTDWKNVQRAKPLFNGHYQPRLPGALGYYDLREKAVQRQQIALARNHGIGGFCFYFYWFNGQRLLEQPVLQFLQQTDLDFPFCLCWANENWSRTWDGLDDDVLIGQDHSPEDDLRFIRYVSRYLKDERYIRVNGKPLLLVYRPSLLPDPKATAERWRNWCNENEVGEIYLAYTQSFEIVDPAELGFDAAIEFPPNNTAPDVVTGQVNSIDATFDGYVYDYNSLMARSFRYTVPEYPLFRGITPSWDNTARRPHHGAVFVGTTPERYGEWIRNALVDTLMRFDEPSERIIFINAWNEWAEGAYLEPDEKYGFAYLEATRKALQDFDP
jgi:hypothetical protein